LGVFENWRGSRASKFDRKGQEAQIPKRGAGRMQREEAITKLREHEAELRQLGIQHLYLFGSTARDDAHEDSDVDLFFDYKRGEFGIFELMDVKEQTSRILGCNVDIMTRDSLHKLLRSRIEASALQVF
jgi:predicted nucleotidyltransferase